MVKFSLGDTVGSKVVSIVTIIILLIIARDLIPVVQTVGSGLVNLPLGGILSNGIVITLIMIGIFITIVQVSFPERK